MPSFKITAVGLALLLTAAALPGCTATASDATPEPRLAAAAAPPIADIPIPRGFQMEAQSSARVIPGSNLRYVDHYYKGNADLLAIVRFYRTRMPENGWTLVSQQQMPGSQFTLNFTKANEDSIITVYPGTFDMHVRAQVLPAGRKGSNP